MNLPVFNQLREWNPQLVRELKGRFRLRNILMVIGISILSQVILFFSTFDNFPGLKKIPISSPYCPSQNQAFQAYEKQYWQIQDKLVNITDATKRSVLEQQLKTLEKLKNSDCPHNLIDFNRWFTDYWTNIFIWISVLAVFSLIVLGTYMLINDLATEERRGTLNFIRLSPQSAQTILIGKLLGVPSLVYLGILLTIPYQLWAGISANISPLETLSFYGLTVASCAFLYSLALLVGVTTSSWLHGLQSWVGSSFIFMFVLTANNKAITHDGWDWLNLFSPTCLLRYLINRTGESYLNYPFSHAKIQQLEWFGLRIGENGVSLWGLALLNYAVLTYWIWQALKRNYNHPNLPALSKKQSYLLTISFTLLALGFTTANFESVYNDSSAIFIANIFLIVGLIFALSPQRQTLQDWVRYRRERKQDWWIDLGKDLVWGEKSPAIVAILINLLIVSTLWIVTISLIVKPSQKIEILLAVGLHLSFMLLCASIAQLMLMMKTPKRTLWSAGIVSALLIIPPFITALLFNSKPASEAAYVWSVLSFVSVSFATTSSIAMSFVGQGLMIILCNVQLTRLLKKAGESELKALASGIKAP
ncbi:hypothetical protein PCC9214_01119 [Planktothrix tepida]|uniref:ABC transporter permease n=1 Tax=Planktothrix tepida PCC 9214 TaxID=671072 RepID=A0A1J1LFU6_9CYAN|nr:hypothetical protein [Planktothrix tepida]CAD5928380.1 hypothetical protein PCC9214_01119 [Planktothrix tepida]CUR31419.1 conserved membrane hypothetical protein [Planktothrix tepida PCC 9214]